MSFLTACRSCIKIYLEKTLIEGCSFNLYASFGTFFVQIGQSFEAHYVFKDPKHLQLWRHFPSKTAIIASNN